ncbi:MAG: Gfo/Idh/MocA family oxidoreductase [Verrucomicrobiota bacterium]|nr:Gfo/Idh/MocA family oxidoreductase [Verrucomicrobiota bacterium]
MLGHGPEAWHPNPAFFYENGGGPMMDLGPYYITALVHLLGPAKSVSGNTSAGFNQRICGHEDKKGEKIPVEVPTHFSGTINFQNGAVITVVMSFDVWGHKHPCFELYGTEGSMSLPNPNSFGGPVEILRSKQKEWISTPLSHGYTDNYRSIGLADMAYAIQSGRKNRCSGELATHVLEIMSTFEKSSNAGKRIDLQTTCAQPNALPLDLVEGQLDT